MTKIDIKYIQGRKCLEWSDLSNTIHSLQLELNELLEELKTMETPKKEFERRSALSKKLLKRIVVLNCMDFDLHIAREKRRFEIKEITDFTTRFKKLAGTTHVALTDNIKADLRSTVDLMDEVDEYLRTVKRFDLI